MDRDASDVGDAGFLLLLLLLYSRTGPRRALSLKLSDTSVYEPEIRTRLRARFGLRRIDRYLQGLALPSLGWVTLLVDMHANFNYIRQSRCFHQYISVEERPSAHQSATHRSSSARSGGPKAVKEFFHLPLRSHTWT